ncbi:MAG: prepilin peptidase [Acidobacteriota bacterium]|nr:prepilin peptidase [Acidobacteriota bacterium]
MSGTVDALVAVFFVGVLAVVSVVDVRRRIIPNRIVLPAAAIVLAARTAVHPSVVWIVAGAGAAAFLLAAAVLRPGGMGMGDVKLALLLGVAVGRSVPLALVVALAAAAVPSVVLLARHGARARTMGIPLAPFLALGGVVALVAGGPLG